LLPERNISKSSDGIVVSVGPGATRKDGSIASITVAVGDKVLLPEYRGLPVTLDDEEGFIFRNDEILAKYTV
jgi:chaperonin GroES